MDKLLRYMFQFEGDTRDRPTSQLDETLTIHGGANSRTGRNSGAERFQRSGNRDLEAGGPEQQHEKIEIRDAGFVAEQIVSLEFVREQADSGYRDASQSGTAMFSVSVSPLSSTRAGTYPSRVTVVKSSPEAVRLVLRLTVSRLKEAPDSSNAMRSAWLQARGL
jgi:hypothetical protein